MSAHPKCGSGHVCQQPSGRVCIEDGCDAAAGTLWGPFWCPDHDRDRLDGIGASMSALLAPTEAATP